MSMLGGEGEARCWSRVCLAFVFSLATTLLSAWPLRFYDEGILHRWEMGFFFFSYDN